MKLHVINTGLFKLDGGAMFGVVPKSIWNKLNPADENNLCTWAMRCLLIETDGRLVLIDTGCGDKQTVKFWSYYHLHGDDSLQKSLHSLGISSSDLTDILLTHLHFDHCGGAVSLIGEKLLPTFSNAQYWSNKDHWDWAFTPNPREKASFLKENFVPIQEAGQLSFVNTSQSASNISGISYLFVSGHTDKQMLPVINYNGRKVIFAADLIPSIHHIGTPYVMAYDMQPLLSMQEKKAVLEMALKENAIIVFQHDPLIECCTLKQTEFGIKPDFMGKLSDILL